ncbi:lysM and putative peptidoglycan-binding domain-containing protein 1-like isoform X2 [Sinocyclocheilus grahami]|uniref:LysM and putative peptidoglycan-binding domain-containing protein 1 n=1 Tax=Sinocyclocheilus grahami TaxID=75366 RepID=A0A672RR87_SINGR|nr:PREDICTED: lysM and putative peptidoglycan-binding domain-containing protein 1-like isoform X2 [Sinocyclocheilus grahami]
MSSDHSASLAGTRGLLRGQRTRSYGSLVSSSLSPVRQRRIKHKVQPGETLQGLSLKYGVSMEEIKRANRLYTNDSIFLKESLFIPVPTESVSFTNGVELTEDEASPAAQIHTEFSNEIPKSQTDSRCEANADLSPVEYLKKIDSLINQSKQAAVKTCQEGEKQFSSMEQLHHSNLTSDKASSQHAVLGAVPITITRRTRNLRDREDEIFQL